MSAEQVTFRNLTLLKFAPSLLSLYAESAGGSRAVPHTSSEALRASGGEAVLDGPMFNTCEAVPPGVDPYATQVCGVVDYKHIDTASGVNFPSRKPSEGMTISVMPDGSTSVANGSTSAPGARVAVQGYPQLVVRGSPITSFSNPTRTYRCAALAVMSDGKLAFVVSTTLTLLEFSRQLAAAGARYAFYTDGGGSQSLETLSGYAGSSEHRRVVTWLVIKPGGSAPSAGAPIGVIAALLAVVAGVGWLWYRSTEKGLARARRNPIDTGVWRRTLDRSPELFAQFMGKPSGDAKQIEAPRENPVMSPAYESALDTLYPALAGWVFYGNGVDKQALLTAYRALKPYQRAAWDREVSQAFVRFHGGPETVMYRRMKPDDLDGTDGISLTTEMPTTGQYVARYRVSVSDVLAHHAQNGTPLSSKAYGHELEVILRPGNHAELLDTAKQF